MKIRICLFLALILTGLVMTPVLSPKAKKPPICNYCSHNEENHNSECHGAFYPYDCAQHEGIPCGE